MDIRYNKTMEYINKEQNLELNRLLLEHKAAMEALNSDRNAARKNRLETGTGTYSRKLVYCKPDEKLGKYILLIFDNIMLRPNYRGYNGELRVDITDNAMIRIQSALHRYDPDKGTGFNFLTMVLTQSIRSTLSEYNSKKDEEDKVEHVTLTTFSDETVHIPVYDDEIEVNSLIYDMIDPSIDSADNKQTILDSIMDKIDYHKKYISKERLDPAKYFRDLIDSFSGTKRKYNFKTERPKKEIDIEKEMALKERKRINSKLWYAKNRDYHREYIRNKKCINTTIGDVNAKEN